MTQKPITDEQLILYAVGDLADPEATATESYLTGSPQATAYVAKVRCVLETMRTDDTEAPSIAMIKRTVMAFSGAEATDEQSGPLAWLEELGHRVAQLIFDSRAQPALAGFRGGTSDYQLTYDSDMGRVELRVSPAERVAHKAWRVRGQVTPEQHREGGAFGSVILLTPGTTDALAVAELDQYGRFKIDSDGGTYDLAVRCGDEAMIAPNLQIG